MVTVTVIRRSKEGRVSRKMKISIQCSSYCYIAYWEKFVCLSDSISSKRDKLSPAHSRTENAGPAPKQLGWLVVLG